MTTDILPKLAEIAPCPFCGGVKLHPSNSMSHVSVYCETCKAQGPSFWTGGYDDRMALNKAEAEAIAAWNRRTPSQSDLALAPKLAEIRAGLEGVTPGPWRAVTLGGSSTILTPTMPPKNDRRSKVTYGYKEGGEYCIAHPFLYQTDYGKPDEATRMDFVCFGHKDAAHIARLDKDTVRAILDLVDTLETTNAELKADLARKEPEVVRLREALEPFANEAPLWSLYSDRENLVEAWNEGPASTLTVGDLRRAALAKEPT